MYIIRKKMAWFETLRQYPAAWGREMRTNNARPTAPLPLWLLRIAECRQQMGQCSADRYLIFSSEGRILWYVAMSAKRRERESHQSALLKSKRAQVSPGVWFAGIENTHQHTHGFAGPGTLVERQEALANHSELKSTQKQKGRKEGKKGGRGPTLEREPLLWSQPAIPIREFGRSVRYPGNSLGR